MVTQTPNSVICYRPGTLKGPLPQSRSAASTLNRINYIIVISALSLLKLLEFLRRCSPLFLTPLDFYSLLVCLPVCLTIYQFLLSFISFYTFFHLQRPPPPHTLSLTFSPPQHPTPSHVFCYISLGLALYLPL